LRTQYTLAFPTLNEPSINKTRWVHAGMYGNTPAHQRAWRHWFEAFSTICGTEFALSFGHGQNDDTYRAKDLFMAQTCGYPLLKKWSPTHYPIATATFNIAGCEEDRYSSWFVCHKNSAHQHLDQFANSTVTVNGSDSNSGCNVLRYAVSQLSNFEPNKPYFKKVTQSGGHWNSLQLISKGEADLAAIDSVSYALALQHYPELKQTLKIIGQSEFSMGLPFIAPNTLALDTTELTEKMNEAVETMDGDSRALLFLKGFVPCKLGDYNSIQEIETAATQKGYAELR
jgi:ABC-type phosphate/phosphonate transport system substrate-binding protein